MNRTRPARSKNGCSSCRRRKVRCDESKPVCNACTRLGLTCSYEPNRASSSADTPRYRVRFVNSRYTKLSPDEPKDAYQPQSASPRILKHHVDSEPAHSVRETSDNDPEKSRRRGRIRQDPQLDSFVVDRWPVAYPSATVQVPASTYHAALKSGMCVFAWAYDPTNTVFGFEIDLLCDAFESISQSQKTLASRSVQKERSGLNLLRLLRRIDHYSGVR